MRLSTLLATALISTSCVTASAANMPSIGVTAIFFGAKGMLLVNGVPIRNADSGKQGTTSINTRISVWLVDVANTVAVAVEPLRDKSKATLKVRNRQGKELLVLEQLGAGRKGGKFTVHEIPKWRWQSATPVGPDAKGLTEAVAKLHAAHGSCALKDIVAMSEPFFTDNKKVGGMNATLFIEHAGPMLKAGTIEPLSALTVTRHADGRMFRVVRADGNPPIGIVVKRDEMTSAIRMGEWWSKFDGTWKVVR